MGLAEQSERHTKKVKERKREKYSNPSRQGTWFANYRRHEVWTKKPQNRNLELWRTKAGVDRWKKRGEKQGLAGSCILVATKPRLYILLTCANNTKQTYSTCESSSLANCWYNVPVCDRSDIWVPVQACVCVCRWKGVSRSKAPLKNEIRCILNRYYVFIPPIIPAVTGWTNPNHDICHITPPILVIDASHHINSAVEAVLIPH